MCTQEASSVEQISGVVFTGGKRYNISESCKLATLLNVALAFTKPSVKPSCVVCS